MARLVAEIEGQRPIALAFLNAGGAFRDAAGDFGGEGFARTFALNVQGVANAYNPVFNAMRARKCGQIAITGSLTGYGGLPNSGAYAPSKAAVISLAVGEKFRADPHNVTVQIVNPGYVKTPLTAHVTFPMPFLMECEEACRRICDGFERQGFEISLSAPARLDLARDQSAALRRLFRAVQIGRPARQGEGLAASEGDESAVRLTRAGRRRKPGLDRPKP